jgi:hypothetical protein
MNKHYFGKLSAIAGLMIPLFAGQSFATETLTVETYVRAESDVQMKGYTKAPFEFGKLTHNRDPYDVNNQITIRGNRDTLYSLGVFDLSSPLTITMPETDGRYQSLMQVSQDHSIPAPAIGAGDVVFTEDSVGTRYVFLIIRTFMNPNDPDDLAAAHALQDQIVVSQANSGTADGLGDWDLEAVEKMRGDVNDLADTLSDTSNLFGTIDEVDTLSHLLGAAFGWGGLPKEAAIYTNVVPEQNDGKTPYSVTAKDVPVDAFWSVSLYDSDGFFSINDQNAYSFNSVTSEPNDDGSITINFGACDDGRKNCLPIVDGWNVLVRQYQPGPEIISGDWTFPAPEITE